jgi:isorenieratene synthase
MERGFHAFFRQYYNLRDLIRRIDPPLSSLTPLIDYPLLGPGGRSESFAGLPQKPPMNLISLVMRTPTLGLRDMLDIPTGPALDMMAYREATTFETYDQMSAGEFLDNLSFPEDARQMLFDIFAHSFFNPQHEMSAAEMLKMFHFYFTGNPEGLVFDVLDGPFSTRLWDPMRRYLESLGVQIELDTEVEKLAHESGKWTTTHAAGDISSEGVVLAVTVPALQSILSRSPSVRHPEWDSKILSLDVTLPFAVWRLWYPNPSNSSRAPFAGTTGVGLLDNISLYHLFEDESETWAKETGGSVVELHAYAVPEDRTEEEIRSDLIQGLHALYPEYANVQPLDERFFVRQDCPAFRTGSFARRPTVQTPFPGLCLAGDFVRLPVPSALMEAAATSGLIAANELLAGWGIKGHAYKSVPVQGLLAGPKEASDWLAQGSRSLARLLR